MGGFYVQILRAPKVEEKKNSDKYIQTGFVNIWDAFVGLKTGGC